MLEPITREIMKQRLINAARTDERIVGLIDYGSSSQGRDDQWSDIDVSLFIRDADLAAFKRNWKSWAAQLGDLLLAYIGGVGHPWTVYAAQPVPLRIDFNFYGESEIAQIVNWPYSPQSVEAAIWYDNSGGQLADCLQQLVGKTLQPENLAATFEQICGDFWYYVLYAFSKWKRDQSWLARQTFHFQIMQNLFALLRIEAGALDHWQDTSAAWNVEHSLSPQRLAQLETCIPAPGQAALKQTLLAAAQLGEDVCIQIALQHAWDWPHELAKRTLQLLSA